MKAYTLDLETMSTAPNAAITAIGMCAFDAEKPEIVDEFYAPVHLATSVMAGGVMDPGAVLFWMSADLEQARQKMLFSAMAIEAALQAAAEWMGKHAGMCVWANAPSFDCVILRSAMQRSGIIPPWSFRDERDVRTLRGLYPSIPSPPDSGIKHFALDDARYEAKVVTNIWRMLNGK